MLFNSYVFILLFLPIVLGIYFFLNHKGKYDLGKIGLIIASFLFVGWMNPFYALILGLSIVVNYAVHLLINVYYNKMLCVLGIVFNIGLLIYFKYSNFFIESINTCFGISVDIKRLILPLGISFYTFQQISFVVDCYKEQSIKYSFVDYCLYVSYFPKLIQGPMAYHSELISQFQELERKKWNYSNASKGLYLAALGLAKKVLLADLLAGIVSAGYSQIEELNTVSATVTTLAYTFQIYFDFSGYCDMAEGVSMMFNINLPVNFNMPYKAHSVNDFWSRWHITLTRFFTKYLYIPLGGNRKGMVRFCINTMIVFLLSGLWHGAAWTFVVWGALHGIGKLVERALTSFLDKIPVFIRRFLTFSFVSFAWVFFRAESVNQGIRMIRKIVLGIEGGIKPFLLESINSTVEARALYYLGMGQIEACFPIVYIVMIFAIAVIIICLEKNAVVYVKGNTLTVKHMIITIVLLAWGILSLGGHSEFLYLNF